VEKVDSATCWVAASVRFRGSTTLPGDRGELISTLKTRS
jgi:hypothetical protein